MANSLAQANVPSDIVRALRLGRITALQKPDNGVRGIGHCCRRVHSPVGGARIVAKKLSEEAKEPTVLHQYALETRAGCECVAHVFQVLTDFDVGWGRFSTSFHGIQCSQVCWA